MGIGLLGGGLAMGGAGLALNGLGLGGGGAMDSLDKSLKGYMGVTNTRATPQAGPAENAQTSGFRNNQADLISRLEAMSRGQGPSLAAEQLRQATDRNMKQQSSIAQTGRGNAALSGIQASNMSGQLGAQAASDSAVARIAEQQMALQQLGQNIGQGRGQDQDLSQFNALQKNYRDQFNVEAQLRARGMNDEQISRLLQMRMGAAQAKDQGSFGNQLMAGGAGLLSMNAMSGGGKK